MSNRHSKHSTDQPTTQSPTANPSYHRDKPFVLTDRDRKAIAWAFADIDFEQIKILRKKTPAERARQVLSMINAAESTTAFRLRQREPELSEAEALRIVRRGLLEYEREKRRNGERNRGV